MMLFHSSMSLSFVSHELYCSYKALAQHFDGQQKNFFYEFKANYNLKCFKCRQLFKQYLPFSFLSVSCIFKAVLFRQFDFISQQHKIPTCRYGKRTIFKFYETLKSLKIKSKFLNCGKEQILVYCLKTSWLSNLQIFKYY